MKSGLVAIKCKRQSGYTYQLLVGDEIMGSSSQKELVLENTAKQEIWEERVHSFQARSDQMVNARLGLRLLLKMILVLLS